MAVMQAMSRANAALPFRSPEIYYLSVTAHGVLMALVFTTFFIMGLGYVVARTSARRRELERAARLDRLLGRAARHRVRGRRDPRSARPACCTRSIRRCRRTRCSTLARRCSWSAPGSGARHAARLPRVAARAPGGPVPLAMHGIITTVIVWLLATVGVAAEMLFHADPVVARADADGGPGAGPHAVLVVRSSARLLLAAARLRALVHGAAARRGRQAVQRPARRASCSCCSSCSRRRSASTTSSWTRAFRRLEARFTR